MIRLIYCVLLLFILSGMYFVSRQSAVGLAVFLIQSIVAAVIVAAVIVVVTKRKEVDFFGTVLFVSLLIVGVLQILFL